MKRNEIIIELDRDQQRTMSRVTRLWATVYQTTFSQVIGMLIEINGEPKDGRHLYRAVDGSLDLANFILKQVLAPDTTELMAMEYARINPEGNYAKFYQDADNLNTYFTNTFIKQRDNASDTNHEHAGAATATA